jgi:hypothetical protein
MERREVRNNMEFSGVCIALKLSVILTFCLVRVVYTIIHRDACVLLTYVVVYLHMESLIFCVSLSYDALVEAEIFCR